MNFDAMKAYFNESMNFRVIYYRHKWLTIDRFDNHYITSYVREIDLKRTLDDKETIFPLNRRERVKYVALSSVLLVKSERIKLSKSIIFLSITSSKLFIYMVIDYCLYWVLDRIRYNSKICHYLYFFILPTRNR